MSGSPKHTTAYLQEQERQRQAAAREALRQQEEARRAQEAARLAEQRRVEVCSRAEREATACEADLVWLLTEPQCNYIPPEVVRELRALLDQARQAAQGAGDEAAASTALRRIEELHTRVRQQRNETASLTQIGEQTRAEMKAAEDELRAFEQSPAHRHVAQGSFPEWWQAVRQVAEQVQAARTLDDLRRVAPEVASLRGRIAEARDRATTLATLAQRLGRDLDSLERNTGSLLAGELRDHLPTDAPAQLRQDVARTRRQLEQATDRPALQAVEAEAGKLQDRLRQLESAGKATRLAADLAQEERELAVLRGEVEGLDKERARKFDGAGQLAVEAGLKQAEEHLTRQQIDQARQTIATTRQAFAGHRARVQQKHDEWLRERAAAQAALAEAQAALQAIRSSDERRRWTAEALSQLETRFTQAGQEWEREQHAGAERAAQAILREARDLARRADELSAEVARLREMRRVLQDVQTVPVKKLDEDGARQIQQLLGTADEALGRMQAEAARGVLNQAATLLARHRTRVQAEAEKWHAEFAQHERAVVAAADEVNKRAADERIRRWRQAELDLERARVEEAGSLLRQGKFGEVSRLVQPIAGRLAQMDREAEELEARAQVQRTIAEGIEKAMLQLGFEVVAGVENADDPASALIVQGQRRGDEIVVAVEASGRVEYEVGGNFEKKEQFDRTLNKSVKTCDEAASQIEEMHKLLRLLGIETDGLHWEDQPPDGGHGQTIKKPTETTRRTTTQQQRQQPPPR